MDFLIDNKPTSNTVILYNDTIDHISRELQFNFQPAIQTHNNRQMVLKSIFPCNEIHSELGHQLVYRCTTAGIL